MPFAVRMRGPLQLGALEAVLQAIERRHDTLRTTFSNIEGTGVQEVHPFVAHELNVVEIGSDDEQDLLDALKRDQTSAFDLENEPGWRVSVYRLHEHHHVLSIVMHHIISDGWSLDLLQKELATLYSAAIRGQDLISHLPPLSIQYRDFSVWQKEKEQIEEHQKQLHYWVKELQTSRPAEFLCDYARPATMSGKAGMHRLEIDGQLYSRLQRFCRAREVTPFVVLLTAFRAAHYRLTNQDDATIGVGNANRDRWGLKDIIGFFVNMQCIRTKIGEDTFEQLVQQVHTAVVASFANQDVPFDSIVSKLQRDRDLSRHPLVQVAFVFHSQKGLRTLTLEGVETETIHGSPASRFDLEFHLFQEEHKLRGQIMFSEDLYRAETVSSLVSVFQAFLETCLDKPKTKIASASLLTKKTYTQLDHMGLLHLNETQYPRESSVIELFRQQATAHPLRIAVKDPSTKMTYAQLDALSDELARWLSTKSLATESLVGVIADRSCQTIITLLSILKANLAYLPFDIKIPGARMSTILGSIKGEKLVLVGDGIEPPELDIDDVRFVRIADALAENAISQSVVRPSESPVGPSATSLAYVMFTSGSTGRPKGVMVEHRGIVRLVKNGTYSHLLPPSGVMAHITNLAFDPSTGEIWGALLNGGTLVCIDHMTVLDSQRMKNIFTSENVQTAIFTPALLKQCLLTSPSTVGVLETLIVGGDRADKKDMSAAQKLVATNVVNAYGPTENTLISTAFRIEANGDFTNGVPIGRAISNSGALVMDPEQQLVPLGVIGELVVTGDGLARGYTDPERNVDRFITITMGSKTMRAYRTGDYVRYRPTDGQMEFFGRIDGQVKIRGHRVELGEIESVLRSHRSVSDAVVVTRQTEDSQCLVSYVMLEEGSEVPNEQRKEVGQSQHVKAWQTHFNADTYAPIENLRPETIGRDFVGWTSMYDGSDIDKAEMNEWLDDTKHAIYTAAGGRPGNVLEIGSGTGMVLFNLLEGLQSYIGLDPSTKAVQFIVETAKSIPALKNKVCMYQTTAAEVCQIEHLESVNFVVLNSVVQYFPSQEYLFDVIESLLSLKGVKTIFFGDVRSYALYREFLATRALRMAGDGANKEDIRRMMEDMEQVERELLVDPGFFTGLLSRFPDLVKHVEIVPKKMEATNELSCYRYAAVVHVKARGQPEQEIRHIGQNEWVDFQEQKLNRQSLLQQLKKLSSSSTLAISNIPHSKTIFARSLLSCLDDDQATKADSKLWFSSIHQAAELTPSFSAVELADLAEKARCFVEVSWSRQYSQYGGLDAIFHQCQVGSEKSRIMFRFPTDYTNRPQHSLSTKPLRQQFVREVQQQLEEVSRAQLPGYMVPQSINVLNKFPINENGKVDRKVLAQRTQTHAVTEGPLRKPFTEKEKTLQGLWARVLNIGADGIGLDHSFFRLGGDSITAIKLVAEARGHQIQITVAHIFQCPKLVDLAALAEGEAPMEVVNVAPFSLLSSDSDAETAQIQQDVAVSCGIDRALIEDIYPCSPLQEGLMSLTSKRAGDYIRQSVLELRDDTDEGAFRTAWEHVVKSSAVLRTRIVQHGRLGLLQVVIADGIQWIEADSLSNYLADDKSTSAELGEALARYAIVKDRRESRCWFVWTIHHSLYDGWSIPLILDSVEKVYNGAVVEKQPHFNTFISYLSQQDQESGAAYWLTTLDGCEATIFPVLPTTVQQPVAGEMLQHQCLPLPQTSSDTTMSTFIHAAWAVIASRYTSSDDVVFGSTVTGRNAPVAGIEAMLGPTIATVPFRARVQEAFTVSTFLRTIQQQTVEMIPYEQTGLQQIAKIGSDARHACGFQTLLVVQPANSNPKSNQPLGVWQGKSGLQDFATYALTVQCTLAAEGAQVTACFDPRVMERWQVEKMLRQFSYVMQQLAGADPESKVADLDLLTPEDRQEIWAWNRGVPPTVERCIHELFAEQARMRPSAPAICAWDGDMTYDELDELSSRLADHLVNLGIQPEDIVLLCFEKSRWTIVAMLAVLKAGGAFAPLDPDHPRSRHEEIFRQTRASLVLTSEQHSLLCRGEERTVVVVSASSISQISGEGNNRKATHAKPTPSNTAYVLFTSGSTGTPKGVVIEHRAISTSCLYHGEALGFTQDTRALQFASYTFDACIAEIITPLLHGSCICVPSEQDRRGNLSHVISSMDVTWSFLTPTVARLLDPDTVPSLRTLTLGGEKVTAREWERWRNSAHVINGYGPAECSVCCAAYSRKHGFQSGIIGQAVGSVGWVVDPFDHNRMTPLGSIGELLIEGPILARGYLDDAQKTTAAFIRDPTWLLEGCKGHPGRRGRLYKTGDLVRYDANGDMLYVGRKDGQVKVRGQRVELGEIEHHVRECMPGAMQMAVEVIAPGGEKHRAVVAAFVQTHEEEVSTQHGQQARVIFPAETDEKLAARLPSYMVPEVYFAVAQLPVTTSGKTDRRRLREMGAVFSVQQLAELRTRSQGPKRSPSTWHEKALQRLWAQVLNLDADTIGLDDSFFGLGGDSIVAMKLVAEARKEDIQLTVANLFQHPRLCDSALNLQTAQIEPDAISTSLNALAVSPDLVSTLESDVLPKLSIARSHVQDLLPITDFQRLCLAGHSKQPPMWMAYFSFLAPNGYSGQRIRDLVHLIWQHYDALRLLFTPLSDHVWQVSTRGTTPPILERCIEPSESHEDVYKEDTSRSFGPGEQLTRFFIISNSKEVRLTLRISHAQYDGLSIARLCNDFQGLANGKISSPTLYYANFINRTLQVKQDGHAYWRSILRGSKMTFIEPEQDSFSDTQLEVLRDAKLPIPRDDSTVASIFTAACASALAKVARQSEVVFARVVNGRSCMRGNSDIFGNCANFSPTRVHFDGKAPFDETVKQLSVQYRESLPYESVGFQDIIENCTDWPSGTEFGCFVKFQNQSMGLQDQSTAQAWPLQTWAGGEHRLNDGCIQITGTPQDGRIAVMVTCGRDKSASIESILNEICRLLDNY